MKLLLFEVLRNQVKDVGNVFDPIVQFTTDENMRFEFTGPWNLQPSLHYRR
jgi:hypothetical protein